MVESNFNYLIRVQARSSGWLMCPANMLPRGSAGPALPMSLRGIMLHQRGPYCKADRQAQGFLLAKLFLGSPALQQIRMQFL